MKCTHCQGSGEETRRVAPVQHTFKSAAKEIRDEAKERRGDVKHWPGQKDMQRMVIQDARDMREVAKLLGAGDAKAAASKAGGMDTAARDHIPQAAWEFMQEQAEEKDRRNPIVAAIHTGS
jgi:hypothetical protein